MNVSGGGVQLSGCGALWVSRGVCWGGGVGGGGGVCGCGGVGGLALQPGLRATDNTTQPATLLLQSGLLSRPNPLFSKNAKKKNVMLELCMTITANWVCCCCIVLSTVEAMLCAMCFVT